MQVELHTRWAAAVVTAAAAIAGLATTAAAAAAGTPGRPRAVSVLIPGDPPAGLPPEGPQILSVDPVLETDSGGEPATT